MSYRITIICLVFYSLVCFAEPDPISPGDWLFIQARVIGCGGSIRDVEVGKVEESGKVTFFSEVSLQAVDQPLQAIAQQVTDAVEELSGHRPTTIRVIKVPRDDPGLATLKMMELYRLKDRGCKNRIPPTEIPDWLYDLQFIASTSHNKSLNSDASDAGAG